MFTVAIIINLLVFLNNVTFIKTTLVQNLSLNSFKNCFWPIIKTLHLNVPVCYLRDHQNTSFDPWIWLHSPHVPSSRYQFQSPNPDPHFLNTLKFTTHLRSRSLLHTEFSVLYVHVLKMNKQVSPFKSIMVGTFVVWYVLSTKTALFFKYFNHVGSRKWGLANNIVVVRAGIYRSIFETTVQRI